MLQFKIFEYDDHFTISWSNGKECGVNYISKDEIEHGDKVDDKYQKLLKLLRNEEE